MFHMKRDILVILLIVYINVTIETNMNIVTVVVYTRSLWILLLDADHIYMYRAGLWA